MYLDIFVYIYIMDVFSYDLFFPQLYVLAYVAEVDSSDWVHRYILTLIFLYNRNIILVTLIRWFSCGS
jgi:hypothetical protein